MGSPPNQASTSRRLNAGAIVPARRRRILAHRAIKQARDATSPTEPSGSLVPVYGAAAAPLLVVDIASRIWQTLR